MPVRRLERKQRYCGPSIAEPAGSAGSVSSAGSTGSAGPQRTPRARRARQIHPADPAGLASRPTESAARSSAARMCVVRLRACALSPCERCGARARPTNHGKANFFHPRPMTLALMALDAATTLCNVQAITSEQSRA